MVILVIEVFKETPAKELTEAHCYPRHRCSELKMLSTLTMVKNL